MEYTEFNKDLQTILAELPLLRKGNSASFKKERIVTVVSKVIDLTTSLNGVNSTLININQFNEDLDRLDRRGETVKSEKKSVYDSVKRYKAKCDKNGSCTSFPVLVKGTEKTMESRIRDENGDQYDVREDKFSQGCTKCTIFEDLDCNSEEFRELRDMIESLARQSVLIDSSTFSTYKVFQELDCYLGTKSAEIIKNRFQHLQF